LKLDETVWLTQSQMSDLFHTTKQNVSLHINNAFKEGELEPNSVVKEYLTTTLNGKSYKTKHYNLDVIISSQMNFTTSQSRKITKFQSGA